MLLECGSKQQMHATCSDWTESRISMSLSIACAVVENSIAQGFMESLAASPCEFNSLCRV